MIPGITAGMPLVSSETDPYWANVIALLHMEGAEGAKTFDDETPRTWTATGGTYPTLSSVVDPTFGRSMINGADGWIETGSPTDFALGTAPFTIEFMALNTSAPTGFYQSPFGNWVGGAPNNPICMFFEPNGVVSIFCGATVVGFTPSFTVFPSITYFISITRDSSQVWRLFINGSKILEMTPGTLDITSTTPFRIGCNGTTTDSFQGRIDEFRVTKGVCRYTANYTPQAGPWPNS